MKMYMYANTAQDVLDEICGLLANRAGGFRKRLYSGKREKEQNEIIARAIDNIRDDLLETQIVRIPKH